MSSPHVGISGGENQKTPPEKYGGVWEFCVSGLDQTEFNCPFDSPPTAIDVEFVVNALGVSPHRA